MNLLVTVYLAILFSSYPSGFKEGDWVTFSNFRFITSAAIDQNNVYFGTVNGVIRYDRFANRWLDPLTITDGIPYQYIDNIAYDPDYDRIWVDTRYGSAYYQPTFRQWYPGTEFPIPLARNDFKASALGALITEYGYMYNNGRLSDLNFNTYQLTKGVDDGFNHLYVGTWGLGPVVINPRYGDIKTMPYGLYTEDATALIRVGDRFWIGAGLDDYGDPGITLCDTSLQQWEYYAPRNVTGIGSTRVSSAVGDGKITWLGTDYGLLRYDSQSETFTTFADFSPLPSLAVNALAADTAWVYVGTDRGLGFVSKSGLFEKRRRKEKQAANSSESSIEEPGAPLTGKNRMVGWRVNCLKLIDNYLYTGTERGALRRAMNTYGDFEYLNTSEGMLSDEIFDIARKGDSLFFATRNDIVIVNTRSGEASTISDSKGFGVWQIRKIIVDTLNVWAATSAGLWKYRFSDGYSRLFTRNDGMISDDVRSLEMVGDYLWLATPKGVIRFFWNDPGRID
jgi:ligand-binding sensor domain-containing protein